MPRTKKTEKKVTEVKKPKVAATGLHVPLMDMTGKEAGTFPLPKEMFSVQSSPKLMAQYVRIYLANQRQGTASTKTRGQIIGSTRKIYKQKGTGKARHGDIKAPIFVGGGVAGGPQPRDYSLGMNKKQKRIVLFSALSLKLKEKNLFGLSKSFSNIEAKTKNMASFLKSANLSKKSALLIIAKMEKNNLVLASRNLPKITLKDVKSLNAYELLQHNTVLFTEEALSVLLKHYLSNES